MPTEILNSESKTISVPAKTANFIYCIVEKNEVSPELTLETDMKEIPCRDIAAITRPIGGKEISEIENERLHEWITNYQQVNAGIFHKWTMIPVRFGTIAGKNEEVEQFLSAAYMHIKSSLARVRGSAEFAVQAYWNLEEVLKEIAAEERLGANEDRIETGRRLFESSERKKRDITEAAHFKLSAVSTDSSEGKFTDKSMIMNRSYLIEKNAEREFDDAMAEIGRENKSYISFKYAGPFPPYSFVPLEFEEGNFETIDRARKELELPERASFAEIKAAHRNLARKYHPDVNPDVPGASMRFRQITDAFLSLEAYCRGCRTSCPSDRDLEYSFSKDTVEKVFVVNRKI